jgi:hypothetical protein
MISMEDSPRTHIGYQLVTLSTKASNTTKQRGNAPVSADEQNILPSILAVVLVRVKCQPDRPFPVRSSKQKKRLTNF